MDEQKSSRTRHFNQALNDIITAIADQNGMTTEDVIKHITTKRSHVIISELKLYLQDRTPLTDEPITFIIGRLKELGLKPEQERKLFDSVTRDRAGMNALRKYMMREGSEAQKKRNTSGERPPTIAKDEPKVSLPEETPLPVLTFARALKGIINDVARTRNVPEDTVITSLVSGGAIARLALEQYLNGSMIPNPDTIKIIAYKLELTPEQEQNLLDRASIERKRHDRDVYR